MRYRVRRLLLGRNLRRTRIQLCVHFLCFTIVFFPVLFLLVAAVERMGYLTGADTRQGEAQVRSCGRSFHSFGLGYLCETEVRWQPPEPARPDAGAPAPVHERVAATRPLADGVSVEERCTRSQRRGIRCAAYATDYPQRHGGFPLFFAPMALLSIGAWMFSDWISERVPTPPPPQVPPARLHRRRKLARGRALREARERADPPEGPQRPDRSDRSDSA